MHEKWSTESCWIIKSEQVLDPVSGIIYKDSATLISTIALKIWLICIDELITENLHTLLFPFGKSIIIFFSVKQKIERLEATGARYFHLWVKLFDLWYRLKQLRKFLHACKKKVSARWKNEYSLIFGYLHKINTLAI